MSSAQATAFRLARHHLDDSGAATPLEVCRDIAGVQAQLMSAAEIAIHVRCAGATREAVATALWTRRTIVKTSAMRATLHLIPAREYASYIAALEQSATRVRRGVLHRIGVTRADLDRMNEALIEALADGPRTYQSLVARVRRTAATAGMRLWLDKSASAVRPAVIEGLICYGPPEGAEVTFVRTDRWLPKQRPVAPEAARVALLRRFLSAYAPATVRDFANWSGLEAPVARATWQALAPEFAEVSVEGAVATVLERDVDAVRRATLDDASVHLLGGFDPLLLAHAAKDHLVAARHYKRVYRAQGWIAPVLLVGGRIAGVWSTKTRGRIAAVEVEPFERLSPAVAKCVERRAEALGRFLGGGCDLRII